MLEQARTIHQFNLVCGMCITKPAVSCDNGFISVMYSGVQSSVCEDLSTNPGSDTPSLTPFFTQTLTAVEGTDNLCMAPPYSCNECMGSMEVNSSTPSSNQSCPESPTKSKLLGNAFCYWMELLDLQTQLLFSWSTEWQLCTLSQASYIMTTPKSSQYYS